MKICVIGAGASGLTSIKACKEENVDVTCYEALDELGGLWKYRDEDQNLNVTTVARSTIINSSKEMSAFSDFIPPNEFPNYMHNTFFFKYIEMYAEKFDLKKHIVYKTQVIKVKESDDHDITGTWKVTTKNLDTNEIKDEIFDSVMVCTGHHNKALWPKFKGQKKFKGKILHAQSYKKPDGFEDQNIVVVGIGNSGGDIASELSTVSKKVYLSTRKGSWILNRLSPGGLPIDSFFINRINNLIIKHFPDLASSIIETLVESRFDHELYGLKPKHRILSQHPTINDTLPNRILSGTVSIKGDIQEFTENGVIFKNEKTITEVDSVIFATGYQICFPFIENGIIDSKDNKIDLYKFQYVPTLKHSRTLAFIGLVQPYGPLIPISESQARWHLQLIKRNCNLPSVNLMLEDISKRNNFSNNRYYQSQRHTIEVDVIQFMDEIAEQYGAKPKLLEILIKDPVLYFNLIFKPSLPYQYRLNGPHSDYKKARKEILTSQERVKDAFKTNDFEYKTNSFIQKIQSFFLSFLVFILTLILK